MKTIERILVEFTASLCRLLGVSSVELERHRQNVHEENPRSGFKGSRRPEYDSGNEQSVALYRSRYGCPTG